MAFKTLVQALGGLVNTMVIGGCIIGNKAFHKHNESAK